MLINNNLVRSNNNFDFIAGAKNNYICSNYNNFFHQYALLRVQSSSMCNVFKYYRPLTT